MARKMTDALIAVAVLVFLIGSITLFIGSADSGLGITTDENLDLTTIQNNLTSGYQTFEVDYHESVANATAFEVKENFLIDKTGRGQSELGRLDGEARTVSFFESISQKMKLHPLITGLIVSAIILTFSALFLRGILGDNRW